MREIFNLQVTVDAVMAVITVEFQRSLAGVLRQGRQTQVWHRFPLGWKIVSAQGSLMPI